MKVTLRDLDRDTLEKTHALLWRTVARYLRHPILFDRFSWEIKDQKVGIKEQKVDLVLQFEVPRLCLGDALHFCAEESVDPIEVQRYRPMLEQDAKELAQFILSNNGTVED